MAIPREEKLFRLGLLTELALAALGTFAAFLCGLSIGQYLDLSLGAWLLGILATVPMLVALAILESLDLPSLRRLSQVVEPLIAGLFAGRGLPSVILVSAAAGLGEEIFFRGFLQNAASLLAGPAAGLAIGSLLFGLAHNATRAYAALATALGGYLGLLFLTTGNLLVPIVAHGLYDAIVLQRMLKRLEGRQLFNQDEEPCNPGSRSTGLPIETARETLLPASTEET